MSKNPSIATVQCPVAGCAERECPVKKFAQRAKTDKSRRIAGKLYFDCPVHGRFGFDGKEAMQNYILEKGKWPSYKEKNEDAETPPASEPKAAAPDPKPPAAKASAPASKKPAASAPPPPQKKPWWSYL